MKYREGRCLRGFGAWSTAVAVVAAVLLALGWASSARGQNEKPKPKPRWMNMQLGPVFSSTINSNGGAGFRQVPKGVAVRVGENGEAAVLYDTDLVRFVAGWSGEFVQIHDGRDALLGNDRIGAAAHFATPNLPGWANVKGSFDDPRPKPFGPVPDEWARYGGLYMHADRVVLRYTVGETHVLESPWVNTKDGASVFIRSFDIGERTEDMKVMIAGGGKPDKRTGERTVDGVKVTTVANGNALTAAAIIGAAPTASLHTTDDGALHVAIAKGKPVSFRVFVAKVTEPQLKAFAATASADRGRVNLRPYTYGGPARWGKPLTSAGSLGKGDGAYVIDTITAPYDNPYKSILHFGGFDFLPNGDAAICTMEGDVWIVSGIDDDLKQLAWKRYATGMYHPLGLKVVDGLIYVLCRDQITRLHDVNRDGEADYYENFNNDCHVGFNAHEFATCLETDPEGNFFYIKGTNGGQTIHDSSVLRVSADGKKLERWATGFRWPNGMGMSPDGVLSAADQQGNWVPSSRVDIVEKGEFYGYMSSHHRDTPPTTYDGPLCWIPHSVDNSCGGQVWVDSDKWGPLNGQMLHFSYGKCRMFLTLREKVGDEWQGGVVQFDLPPFISGAMRGRFNPRDGQLYVCGLKGWQTSGARDGCFQRVRYTGEKVSMPVGLNVKRDGIRIEFTQPVDAEIARDRDSWLIERWNYKWAKAYGSKEYSVENPDQVGHDRVAVQNVRVENGGKTVFLEIADLKPVMQMMIRYDLDTADGEVMKATIYHTIHALGK